MTLLADHEDRSIEAPPARRTRVIASGEGPRAPWLASAAGGLLALALLSAAAAPMALEARAWIRDSLRMDAADAGLSMRGAVVPALLAAAAVIIAALLGHVMAQGAWLRMSAWRRGARAPLLARVKAAAGTWVMCAGAVIGGVAGALPWMGSLTELARRPLDEGAWAVAAFVASAALGALVASVAFGLVQLHLRVRAFDRALRMTQAEAREQARQEAPARARATPRMPWRLA